MIHDQKQLLRYLLEVENISWLPKIDPDLLCFACVFKQVESAALKIVVVLAIINNIEPNMRDCELWNSSNQAK